MVQGNNHAAAVAVEARVANESQIRSLLLEYTEQNSLLSLSRFLRSSSLEIKSQFESVLGFGQVVSA